MIIIAILLLYAAFVVIRAQMQGGISFSDAVFWEHPFKWLAGGGVLFLLIDFIARMADDEYGEISNGVIIMIVLIIFLAFIDYIWVKNLIGPHRILKELNNAYFLWTEDNTILLATSNEIPFLWNEQEQYIEAYLPPVFSYNAVLKGPIFHSLEEIVFIDKVFEEYQKKDDSLVVKKTTAKNRCCGIYPKGYINQEISEFMDQIGENVRPIKEILECAEYLSREDGDSFEDLEKCHILLESVGFQKKCFTLNSYVNVDNDASEFWTIKRIPMNKWLIPWGDLKSIMDRKGWIGWNRMAEGIWRKEIKCK